MTDTSDDRLLTVHEVADQLRIDPETVRRMLRDGRLHGSIPVSPRGGWRIPTSEVTRLRRGPAPTSPVATAGTRRQAPSTPWPPMAGRLSPHKPPYGYRVNELGEWEQVPEEIRVICDIATWRIVNGASYPVIAARLNAAGIPSPKAGAKGWNPATVWRILRYEPYWTRPDLDETDDSWAAIRLAQETTVTGFLGDAFPRAVKTGAS